MIRATLVSLSVIALTFALAVCGDAWARGWAVEPWAFLALWAGAGLGIAGSALGRLRRT